MAVGEEQDVAVDARGTAAMTRSARARPGRWSRRPATGRVQIVQSGNSARGCRPSDAPRGRRSPTRGDRDRGSAPSPKPASRAVSVARDSGLVSTSANGWPASRRPERRGLVAPGVGQRDVGPARVPAEPRPLGLAVADEPESARARPVAVGRRQADRRSVSGRTVVGRVGGEELARPPAEERRQARRPGPARSACCSDRPGRCRARAGPRSSPRDARSRPAGPATLAADLMSG